MRRIVHRLLSGFPVLALTLLGLWITAFPVKAAETWTQWSAELRTNAHLWQWCAAAILSYFAIWSLTSIDPPTKRQKIQKNLRALQHVMSKWRIMAGSAQNDEDYVKSRDAFDSFKDRLVWIEENMGEVAFERLNSPPARLQAFYNWPSNSESTLKTERDDILILADARIKVLDEFLQSDA